MEEGGGNPGGGPTRETGPATPVPRQVPAPIPGFVGRTRQLAVLTRLLGDPASRERAVVSAIIGPAGVGKTALATQWAQQVQDRFFDGQLYVNLCGHDPDEPVTAQQALDGFLRALGVPAEKVPAGVDARAALYRSLLDGRRVLVVMDNAGDAPQVSPLLPESPGCAGVVTSRSRLFGSLARDGVHSLTLGTLTRREAIAVLRHGIGAARVDAEPAMAAELARLCARLPLALQIAAGRAAVHRATLAELVEEFTGECARPDVPAGDDRVTAVRAAFSWAYRALPSDAARVLRLLGLHAGPDVSTPAAAALGGMTVRRVRPLLDVLTGVHLLEETRPDRFRFHDLLHGYAAERASELPEPERAAAELRVLTWYLHTADSAVRAFSPLGLRVPLKRPGPSPAGPPPVFTDHGQALGWCDMERANLVAATGHAARCGQHVLAWQLAAVLWDFFSMRGHYADWITTHQLGLAAARQAGDRHGEAWMENNLGTACRGLGQFEEALQHFHRALAVNVEIRERRGEGWTRYNIGDTYRELGRLDEALDHLRQALFIGREVGERWSEGYTLNMIGDTYRGLGRFGEALRHLLPALVVNRELGHRRGEGFTLSMIGDTYQELRQFDQALSYHQQSLAVRREIGDRRGEARTLHSLGVTHERRRRFSQALNLYQQALAIHRDIGDRRGEALTLQSLGTVQQHSRQPHAARESWRQALAIFDDLGDPQAVEVRSRLESLGAETAAEEGSREADATGW